jgi:hypothetical protein
MVRYETLRPMELSFFDAEAYAGYALEVLGDVADSLRIPIDEMTGDGEAQAVRAYYQLLGVGVPSEYGWICEYSTVGMAPMQRRAAIVLVDLHRRDLLLRLLRGPNAEGRVYAADALLYLDQWARAQISENAYPGSEFVDYNLLEEEEKAEIDAFRRGVTDINTCGNSGSYKLYPRPVNEVLSDSSVAELADRYQYLRAQGYFQY